ncbi:MAG: hypothetical protein MZU95_06605 [Desulfomicrobium escambiense]|nr:hypothetical protein [Desulfomicrobium escambiense]
MKKPTVILSLSWLLLAAGRPGPAPGGLRPAPQGRYPGRQGAGREIAPARRSP